MSHNKKIVGILAEYDSPSAIFHACEKVRDAGFKNFDSYTPFPVHNLDKAMGIKPSILPWLVLIAGLSGGILAIGFMVWASAFDYPLNIGGKPTWSIPAFIPITFEVTILFSALTAVFGMFYLTGLPKLNDPLFDVARFHRATDDKFFIMIGHKDAQFDLERTKEFLQTTNPSSIEMVEA